MMYALLFFWIDAFKVCDGARFVLVHFLFHHNLGDMVLRTFLYLRRFSHFYPTIWHGSDFRGQINPSNHERR